MASVWRCLESIFLQDVIRLIRWQMTPRSDSVDPNRWIYRFGHTISFNDCAYRAAAKYVALVDTDEFIIPRSKSTSSFAQAFPFTLFWRTYFY